MEKVKADRERCGFKQANENNIIPENEEYDLSYSANFNEIQASVEVCSNFVAISAEVSNSILTIIQAVSATFVGVYVVLLCAPCDEGKGDIIYGCRCRMVEVYLWVLWSYFVSDILHLYKIHVIKHPDVTSKGYAPFIFQGK